MPDDDKPKKLYNNLKEDGYNLGDYDSFMQKMSDPTSREKFRSNMAEDGYNLGDSTSFSTNLGFGQKKSPSQAGGNISSDGAAQSANGSEASQIGAIAGLIKRPAQVDTPTPDNPNDPYKKAASLVDNNSVKGNVLPEVDEPTYQKTLQAANTILPSEVKTSALSPELSGRLQTTRQAINDPTNRKLAPDMAFEMGNTQRFADMLKAKHTDDGYVDADGKPITNFNEGDIISVPKDKPLGDNIVHKTGYIQVINDKDGHQTYRDISPSDPSFSDQPADASNNVTVYPNPSLSSKNKQQDYEAANYNVINKYPALGGYIHIAKQQDAAIGIGKLLDNNPTVAAKMNEIVSKNPDLVSTEESRVATLNKATVQAYDLDKDAFAPDPSTNKMVDAPRFYQYQKAWQENQTAAKALMVKAAPIKAALDKEPDPARKAQLTESYNNIVDQSQKLQDSDKDIKTFFDQPENKLVLDRLAKQQQGQAVYSNLHKFFPKREAREADIEKVQAAPTTIPSALAEGIKSMAGGAIGGVNSIINTIDNGISNIVDSDAMHRDNIAANDKSELNNEANLSVKVHDSDIGNFVNGTLHTVGGLAPIAVGSTITGGSTLAAAALNFSTGALGGYGDTKLEALRSGVPEKEASIYALANGVMTGVIYTGLGNLAKGVEGFRPSMGTIQGLLDKGTQEAAEKSLTNDISAYYLQKTGNTITHAAQESLKMQVQQGINYLSSNYINNKTGSNLKVDAPSIEGFLKTAASFSVLGGMHFSEDLKNKDVRDKFIGNAVGENMATSLGIINTLRNNPDIKISDLNRLNDVESAIVDNLAYHIPKGMSTSDKAKIVALNERFKTANANAESTSGTLKAAYEKEASGIQKEINEVIVPKEDPEKEVAKEEPVAKDENISNSEYNDFIDKGNVTDERLTDIAEKVKNNKALSDRENEIFADKTSEINKIIADQKEVKPTLVAVQSPKEVADSQKETTTIAPKPQESTENAQVEPEKATETPQGLITPEHITHDGKYKLSVENGQLKAVHVETGEEVSDKTKRKIIASAVDSHDFTGGDRATFPEGAHMDERQADLHTIEHTTAPSEVAQTYLRQEPAGEPMSGKDMAIHSVIGKMNIASIGDLIHKDDLGVVGKKFGDKNGLKIDQIAVSASMEYGDGEDNHAVTPEDVADYLKKQADSKFTKKTLQGNSVAEAAERKFMELTGLPLDRSVAEKAVNQVWEKEFKDYHNFAEEKFYNQQQLEDEYYRQFHENERPAETGGNDTDPKENGNNGLGKEEQDTAGESRPVGVEGTPSSEGAATGEADEPSPTSVKNATVYKEREERGDDPIVKAIGRSYEGTVMPEAREKIANGTDPKDLAKNILQRKADGVKSDTESAILLIGRNQLHLEKDAILKDMESAQDNGDKDAYNEASNRLAANEDAMRDNDNAAEHLGGESARGLAARRMMMNRDYSLAAIERKIRAHTADGELPHDFKQKFDKLINDHEELNKKYDEAVKRAEAAEAQTSVDNIDADNKQTKKASKTKKASVADRALSKLDEWEKKIKSAGYADVTGVVSLIQTGITAAKLAIKAGQSIHEALKSARAKIEEHFGKDWDKTEWENVEKDVFGIGEHDFEMKDGKLVVPTKLLHELVENGFKDHASLTDKVHEMAKEQFPDLTKREVRDAITGYGKTLNLNKGEIERQLREIKQLGRLQSGLEDVTEKGQSPLRSGLQRDKPTDLVRNATKKVKDAMKKMGIEVKVDNRTQDEKWASALDAVKTRLTNRITDLKAQIDRKEKDVRKKGVEYDDKAKELKAEADSLQKTLDDMVGKPEMTDEERTALAEKAMQRSIAEVDDRIQKALKGDYTEKERKKVMQSDKMKSLEAERAEKKEFLKSITPKEILQQREDEAYLKAAKSAQEAYAKRLQERLDNRQFDPIAKKIRPEDAELNRLRAANKLKKRELEQAIANYKKDNRTTVQKRFDAINQFRRAMLLSNPLTIGKLASAAAQRILYNPIENVAGAGVSKLLPSISAKAPIEGGKFDTNAHWQGMKELVSLATRQDAAHMWKTGHSILSEMNEKGAPRAELKTWERSLEFFGMIHQQMKNPVKRMAYKYAYEKAIDNAASQGKDINAPGVMEGIKSRAYQYANRQIFMQDNLVSDFYKQGITWLERQKKDDKPNVAATNMAAAMRFLLPIVKVPTNFVNEKSSYAIGVPKAMIQIGRVYGRELAETIANKKTNGEIKVGSVWSRAMDNMTEDQADYVIRQLKKGIVGSAVMALGYANPTNVGGYYSGNRKKGDLDAGDIELFGMKIPHLLQHAPLLEMLQLGATIRRAHDKAGEKFDESAFAGWGNGMKTIVHENIEDIPYWKTPSDLVDAFGERKSLANTMGRLVKGFVIPPIVQQAAQLFDHNEKGEVKKRAEDGFWDAIKSGIPAWRNTLEEKNVKQNAKTALSDKIKDGANWDDLPEDLKTKAGFKTKTVDIGTSEKDFIRDSKMDASDVAFRNMKSDKQKMAFDKMTDDEKKAHIKLLHPDNIGEAITKYIPEKDRESFVMGLSQQQESAYKSTFVNGMPVDKVWDAYQNGDLSKTEFDKYLYDQNKSKKVSDDIYEKYKESESPETEMISSLGRMSKEDLAKQLDKMHTIMEANRNNGTLTKKDYKLYQDAINIYGTKNK